MHFQRQEQLSTITEALRRSVEPRGKSQGHYAGAGTETQSVDENLMLDWLEVEPFVGLLAERAL